jgi:hypothetical protein
MLAQTREQRFSVHHLTNLGGLVALAGLDLESPDLVLGALPEMADVLANCSADQRPALASRAHKSSNNEREASRLEVRGANYPRCKGGRRALRWLGGGHTASSRNSSAPGTRPDLRTDRS